MFSAFSTYVQVQVLPESRFWLRISIEFHLKKWDKKSPVTVVVTGFFAPISKSVRIVGCGRRVRVSDGHLCAKHRSTDRGGSRDLEPIRAKAMPLLARLRYPKVITAWSAYDL
jgi:hypothetical protein